MEILTQFGPQFAAMLVLVFCSGFFSGSEAALFSLGSDDRRTMHAGNPAQRLAADLLDRPARLLTAILFCNLLVNLLIFAMGAIVSLQLQRAGQRTEAGIVTVTVLMSVILFGEMFPKLSAVLMPRFIAGVASLPLTLIIRAVDPLLSLFQWLNYFSRRLLMPRFEPEVYLELSDLERAIELSTTDKTLVEQERMFLANVVALSDMRVEEIMRPRRSYSAFRSPVHLSDLVAQPTPTAYALVAEPDSDEIAAAISLGELTDFPHDRLEYFGQSVIYIPWSATVAAALDALRRQHRQVAAVINEHGETLGIVTMDDILETVARQSSRSERVLRKAGLRQIDENTWEVAGMTTLRRLSKMFAMPLPDTLNVTVAGVIHEELQRIPQVGDVVTWGPFELRVAQAPERGALTAHLKLRAAEGASE